MRPWLTLLFIAACCTFVSAQAPDSARMSEGGRQAGYDSLIKANSTRLDTTVDRINGKIDRAQSRVKSILNPDFNKLTSRFRRKDTNALDTLQAKHELDSMKAGLSHKIDSLKTLNLPTERYTKQLDSIKQLNPIRYIEQTEAKARDAQDKLQRRINQPITDAQNKINDPLNKIEDKVNKPIGNIESKVNEKLGLMKSEGGEGANLPGNLDTRDISLGNANLPGAELTKDLNLGDKVNLPGNNLGIDNPLGDIKNPIDGQLNNSQLGDLKEKAGDIKSLPQDQLNKIKSADELKSIQEKTGSLNAATDKLQGYGDDAKNIANGNLGEVKALPNALEEKAKNLDELKDLEKQTGEFSKVQELANKGNNPEALKEMAQQQVVQQAKDHFAGKEEALKAAMDKMAKLKSKYSEVSSLKDLPKRVPNPMKSKPLIERFVPGFTFQVQKQNNVLVDLNPSVSFRFTGRINAGLGWNERLSFSDWNKTVSIDRIFGPRAFGSFMIKKGFGVKAEIEKMNTFIPPFSLTPDAGHRTWVWSAFVGLKKDYKFMKNVNGNVQILYNLWDDHDNSPYVERLNVRMGFEFPVRKKRKPN